jgi:hypothetical protein
MCRSISINSAVWVGKLPCLLLPKKKLSGRQVQLLPTLPTIERNTTTGFQQIYGCMRSKKAIKPDQGNSKSKCRPKCSTLSGKAAMGFRFYIEQEQRRNITRQQQQHQPPKNTNTARRSPLLFHAHPHFPLCRLPSSLVPNLPIDQTPSRRL